MKRIFFPLIISFFASGMAAQTISNGFYFIQKKDIGFQAEGFEFYGKNKFAYVGSGCSGTTFGKGSYEITNSDSLILTFEDNYTPKLYKELSIQTDKSENLEIDLTVTEDEEIPLPGVSIVIKELNKEFISDFDGYTHKSIKKPAKAVTLEIRYVGYYPIEIPLPKGTSKVSGKVSFRYLNSIPKNEKMSFKILRLKNSRIIFQSHTRSRTFLKINRWKMARKLKKHMPDFYEKMFQDFFYSI